MQNRAVAISDLLHAVGVDNSPVVAVPPGSTKIGVAVQRKGWTDLGKSDVVEVFVEVSLDGIQWLSVGGFTSAAGEKLKKDGTPATESSCLLRLPRELIGQPLFARASLRSLAQHEGLVELIFDDVPLPVPVQEHNSVTYDSDLENTATFATSLTISALTVGNNANRYMIVGVASWDAAVADSLVSAVTFNGSGTGWAQKITQLNVGDDRSTLWGLTAPAVATGDIVVSMGGTCSEVGANALSAYDVDQTTPLGTAVGSTGTINPITVTVSDAADNDLIYDCAYGGGLTGGATVGADQTQLANSIIVGSNILLASRQAGSADDVMSWTCSPTSGLDWAQTAVALKVAQSPIVPSYYLSSAEW